MLRQNIVDMDNKSLYNLYQAYKDNQSPGVNDEVILSWIEQEIGRRDLAMYQQQAADLWFSGGSCTGGKPE